MFQFRAVVFFFTILLLNQSAAAQDGDPKKCASIRDDRLRLECFDLLFQKTPQTIPVSRGNWQVTQEKSKIDDTSNVFLQLRSTEPVVNRYGRQEYLILWIACREKQTSLYIIFGGHFMASLNTGGDVVYRVDKRPAQKKSFRELNDHKALGLWTAGEAIPFVRNLFDGSVLYVRTTPHSESSVSGEFNITGIEEAIKPLSEACSWSKPRSQKKDK